MKIWKVYAQCVLKVNPITEIYSIDKALDDLLNHALENGAIELDDEDEEKNDMIISDFVDRKREEFEKYGILECGDYEIVRSDEMPTRPNICGYDI